MMAKKCLLALFVLVMLALPVLGQDVPETLVDVENLSFEDLLSVEVTAASKKSESLNDAPGIMTVISHTEIEGFSARSLGEVLNRIPGAILLTANVFPSNSIEMRGQSFTPYNNHVLFLLNGRPFRDPITGGLNSPLLTGFPVDALERIEVIRGPGSVLYGSCAYSGVINLVTRDLKEDGLEGKLAVSGGNQGIFWQGANLAYRKDRVSLAASVYHHDDSGPEFSYVDYLGVDHGARYDRKNLSAVAKLKVDKLTVNASVLRLDQYSLAGADNNWDFGDPYDNNNHTALVLDAGYSFSLGQKSSLDANITFNRHIWETDGHQAQYGNDLMGELTFKSAPTDRLNLIFGGTFASHKWSGDLLINGDMPQGSLYAQIDYRVTQALKFIGGFQWNKIEGVDANLSPRAGLIYSFSDKVGVKALYSKAFRKGYPLETSFDLFVFRGNLELQPELVDTAELQLFMQGEGMQLNVTGYYSKMTNMITRQLFTDPEALLGWYLKYVNGGYHEFCGVELEGKGNLTRALFAVGSLSYQTNRSEAGITDSALHPNFMFKLGILYRGNGFDAGVFNTFVSKPKSVGLINAGVQMVNPEAESHDLLGVKFSADLFRLLKVSAKSRIRLHLSADNILGTTVRYPEFTSRGVNTLTPLYSGMTVAGGASFEF
jgi:outer membrane receptor protein involved in Fe transport